MFATCQDDADRATAPARSSGGTRLGMRDEEAGFMKARATPKMKSSTKIHVTPMRPATVRRTMAPATADSAN
jgi:hypothetical protein